MAGDMIFDKALNIILQNEGGYTYHPADKGGETYRGIARNYAKDWKGWKIIDEIKKTRTIKSGEIIPNIELNNLVKNFYKTQKWDPANLDAINNEANAILLFDMVTQHGNWARVANIGVQNKVGKVNWFTNTIPNRLTTDTLQQINTNPKETYERIANARYKYVEHLVSTGSLAQVFEKGVLARVQRYIDNAYKFVFSPTGVAPTTGILLLIAAVFFLLIKPKK
jgi:lysozyme family protein